jgi:hypothetical protein
VQSFQLFYLSIKSIHSTLSGRHLPIMRCRTLKSALWKVFSASATCEACICDAFAAAPHVAAGQLLALEGNLVDHAALLIMLHGVIVIMTESFEGAQVIQTAAQTAWALSEKGQRVRELTQSTHEHQLQKFSHCEQRRSSCQTLLGFRLGVLSCFKLL